MVTVESLAKKLELAKAEIGENEQVKEQCLAQFREWISQNGDIENCFTDDIFLLKFLRTKKFSLFMAQQMILKYLNFKKQFIRYMDIMDCEEAKTNELITNGYIFASPFRDSEGRRVVIYNIIKFDLQRYSNIDLGRVHAVTWEALLEDEDTQVLGVNHIADLSGSSPALATLFPIRDIARIITWGEQSFPLPHKEIHLINIPPSAKYIFEYLISKLSRKLRERLRVENSLEELTNKVDKKCLPLEFGGVMPMAEMIQIWKKELLGKRDRLISLNNIHLLSDQGILNRKNLSEHNAADGLIGSFRKLEVD